MKFRGTSATTKKFIFTLIVVITVLGSAIFLQTPKEGPDVPFNELSTQAQSEITEALDNGNQALKFNDYNGALHYFNNAYELHPKNPESIQGLNFVVNEVLTKIKSNQEKRFDKDNLKQISTLLEYSSLSKNESLINMKNELEQGSSKE
jgi:hypothetical protein